MRGELDRAQEELALIEERLSVADQHLAEDEGEAAASSRDLRVLAQQLSAMRLALVDARHRLAEQEARLAGSCPAPGEGAGQAALLELQQCREDVAALREGQQAACSDQAERLAQAQRDAAQLREENGQLVARWAQAVERGCKRRQAEAVAPGQCRGATDPPSLPFPCPPRRLAEAQGTCAPCVCPPAQPCTCEAGSHIAAHMSEAAPRPARRTELLQNQVGAAAALAPAVA